MTPTGIDFAQERLVVLARLANLLERFERGQVAFNADQYRMVVQRLESAFRRASDAVAVQAVLDAHPAAAELYENLNYDRAGLARTPLDVSVASERLAAQVIDRVRR